MRGKRECGQHTCVPTGIRICKLDAQPEGTPQDKTEISMHAAMSLRFIKLTVLVSLTQACLSLM